MQLVFPELGGGPFQGLNDAGVENFQGAIDAFLARECGQNTGDAPRPGSQNVRLEFSRLDVPTDQIPAIGELRASLAACLERCKELPKEREFFETALETASERRIAVLKISDYGTTGLTGGDLDEKGRWFALVKSQGLSNKEGNAGGSFGIGKSSPFAASRFRTVFYGTRTGDDATALQGVCRLVTHKNASGRLTQGTGFIGEYDSHSDEDGEPVFRAMRGESSIPLLFRRREFGTDIWVIAYRSGPEWSSELIKSILTNFWPAIHRGSISFKVGEEIIDETNCAEMIDRYAGQEDFEAQYYYRAVLSQPAMKRLKYTGSSELYLTASSPDLPKKICMVRANGMRIFDYQPRACRVPFSGLFTCSDPQGNRLLREMEPPKHDAWDPKRIEGSDGKKALDEIKAWIREEVKKLNPLFSGKSFNESELAKYLPDHTPDDFQDVPDDLTGDAVEESLEPLPRSGTLPAKAIPPRPVSAKPGDNESTAGGHGDAGTDHGGKDGNGGPDAKGQAGGSKEKRADRPHLRVRSFSSVDQRTYQVVLRSDANFSGAVTIRAVGEDGARDGVVLQGAKVLGSEEKELLVSGDAIKGITLVAGVPLRVEVTLDAVARRSLSAMASS